MSPEMPCPSAAALRRSIDPDDPTTVAERRQIEAHVDRCQRGCKQVIDALLRGDPTLLGPEEQPAHARAEDPVPVAATADHPDPPTAIVAREEPDAETRVLLRRQLLVILSILAVAVGFGVLAELVADNRYGCWHWLMPGLWAGLVTLLGTQRLSLAALRRCELVGFGVLSALYVYWTAVVGSADSLRHQPDGPNPTNKKGQRRLFLMKEAPQG